MDGSARKSNPHRRTGDIIGIVAWLAVAFAGTARGSTLATDFATFAASPAVTGDSDPYDGSDAQPRDEKAGGLAADETATDAHQEHRERVATVGTLLLVGIAVVGMALMWAVMLWGRRLRRIARKQVPATTVDELWYLKPPKSPPENRQGDGNRPDATPNETPPR